jgi:hypothetical protein
MVPYVSVSVPVCNPAGSLGGFCFSPAVTHLIQLIMGWLLVDYLMCVVGLEQRFPSLLIQQ